MINPHRLILFTIPLLNIVVLSMLQLKSLVKFSPKSVQDNFGNMTLLIVAHPDDETMFFGPTIMNLIENKKSLIILCLTDGNADNLGSSRRQELADVTEAFGPYVTSNIISDIQLKDGVAIEWKPEIVSNHVERYIRSRNFPIQTIVTFDSTGVSGHANHRSIYMATKLLKKQLKDLKMNYFYLNSVSIWRKYISFLDASVTVVMSFLQSKSDVNDDENVILAIDYSDNVILRRILQLHRSQMVWFRQLYMIFSRYMLINDLSIGY